LGARAQVLLRGRHICCKERPMHKRIVITVVTIALVISACFVGLHEYLRRTEIQQKEELMRIELATKQAEIMLQEEARLKLEEAEKSKREAAAKEAEAKREAAAREEEERKAAEKAANDAAIAAGQAKTAKLIGNIEKSVRKSYLKNYVLQLNNPSPVAAVFDLKCYHLDGNHKTLHISIDAYQSKEIGFQEGWTDNFLPGEKVEALADGNVIWAYTIP